MYSGINKKIKSGDIIRVAPGTFPGYPFCIFAITGFMELNPPQICIKPIHYSAGEGSIWVNYDEKAYILITDSKQKEMLEALYGRVKS